MSPFQNRWFTSGILNKSTGDFILWEPGTSYRFCRTEVHFSLQKFADGVEMTAYTNTWHWNCASSDRDKDR